MKLALWVLFALAILIVAYLAVGLFVAMRLSAPSRQPQEQTPADVGLGYREVSLRSADGLRLAAWWGYPETTLPGPWSWSPAWAATSPIGMSSRLPPSTPGRATAC